MAKVPYLSIAMHVFDFAQVAAAFAATILNNPVLLDGTKIFKGPKGTVSSITYDYLHGDMAYTNKFIVQTKTLIT